MNRDEILQTLTQLAIESNNRDLTLAKLEAEVELLRAENERLRCGQKAEAVAFANWLSNTAIGGRTIYRLWWDYQTELDIDLEVKK